PGGRGDRDGRRNGAYELLPRRRRALRDALRSGPARDAPDQRRAAPALSGASLAALSRRGHGAVDLAPVGPLADRLAFVGRLLSAGEAELDLGAAPHPVESQRDQGVAALLDLAGELVDLAPVQQELPVPLRLVPELARR